MLKGFKKGECCLDHLSEVELSIFIKYYEIHSTAATAKQYHIHKERLLKFLVNNNIPIHSKQEDSMFTIKQRSKILLEKYGCINAAQSKEFQDKKHQTCIERYGEDYQKQITEKAKKTKLARYGDSSYNKYEQIKLTNIQKYGVPNPLQHTEIKKKRAETMFDRYGVYYPAQDKLFRDKQIKTTLARLGTKNYIIDNVILDSKPELAYYLWCKETNKHIVREPIKLKYFYKDKAHVYFPDFEVDGQLIEIKGDHLFKKMLVPNTLANAKYNCMSANNVKIITSNKYRYYISFCENKFGKKWFLQYKSLYNK